jgi:hypothetical protein
VQSIRPYLARRRWPACCIIGLSLFVRLLVPAGYMPAVSGHIITIEICSGQGPMQAEMVMPGMTKHQKHGAKEEMPCGFGGLSMPSTAGAPPALLSLAIAFIVTAAYRSVTPTRAASRLTLRPPPTGPPLAP